MHLQHVVGQSDLAGFKFRKFQYLADDAEQESAGFADIFRITAIFRRPGRAEYFLGNNFRESDDRVQRRTQFMAHGREQARFRPAGVFRHFLGAAQRFFRRHFFRDFLKENIKAADLATPHRCSERMFPSPLSARRRSCGGSRYNPGAPLPAPSRHRARFSPRFRGRKRRRSCVRQCPLSGCRTSPNRRD